MSSKLELAAVEVMMLRLERLEEPQSRGNGAA